MMKNWLTTFSILFISLFYVVAGCEKKRECEECYNDSIYVDLDFINRDSISFSVAIEKRDSLRRDVKAYVSVYDEKDGSFCLLKTYYKKGLKEDLINSSEMTVINSGIRHTFIYGEFIKLELETYCYDGCGTVNTSKETKYLSVEIK